MTIRSAMRALTDEQLHERHTVAQAKVAYMLATGNEYIMGPWVRQARAAEREILARDRHVARRG